MTIERHRIQIEGVIQGVGFRPFVYRLARQHQLSGWVANHSRGVQLEVEGEAQSIGEFLHQLAADKPSLAVIKKLESCPIALTRTPGFSIKESVAEHQPLPGLNPTTCVPADMAPCEDCLRELFDVHNRRYLYPFSNCTACGPRFTIIDHLPYDRSNTTLQPFAMCERCLHEYHNPADRRFHAEPTACPDCGPQLQLWTDSGEVLAQQHAALKWAVSALLEGKIVALKGVGGFQLLADASNCAAVNLLRQRKQRPTKPFALLYPDIDTVQQHCQLNALEQQLLLSPQRPIVILPRKELIGSAIASASIAPGNGDFGVMLPASPLHHLLCSMVQRPLVATSGNIAGEPICISNEEALDRLAAIADLMLIHDRAIVRPVDDSVVRVIDGVTTLLRRSRGYAPVQLALPKSNFSPLPGPQTDLLAVGGHLKNTVAIARGNQVYLSQHLGDLTSRQSQQTFTNAIDDLKTFYSSEPGTLIHDQHPTYASTLWAQSAGKPCLAVPHHIAHFFSCMAEHQHRGPALGVSWDGSGYSTDGVIRGGEFFLWNGLQQLNHLATLRPFPLPGGEQAIREPRRQAAGLLFALGGSDALDQATSLRQAFNSSEQYNLSRMLARRLNSPLCSSVGRLFDAVAALLGLATHNDFEGQAAMALENCARSSAVDWHFPFEVSNDTASPQPGQQSRHIIDWGPAIEALLECQKKGLSPADSAAAFHNTLAQMIITVTEPFEDYPLFLSGGVFQNKRLTETTTRLLRQRGRQVDIHQTVPTNDGGLALGQLYYARTMERVSCV